MNMPKAKRGHKINCLNKVFNIIFFYYYMHNKCTNQVQKQMDYKCSVSKKKYPRKTSLV